MFNHLTHFLDKVSVSHLNILFLLGLALFGGTIGGRIFQKLRIPQVVGYIIIGILIGQTGAKIIDKHIIESLQPLNYFALGLIGFMIGGELKKEVFGKYGKQFIYILFSEGITAFLVVALFVCIVGYIFFKNIKLSFGLGLLLGAIASATAPAATTDVLWEYRTKGPLTTTVLGIVAMDDGLSLFLFAIASSITVSLLGQIHNSLFNTVLHPLYEIIGAIAIGSISGWILSKILKNLGSEEGILAFSIGTVLLVLGISLVINVDMLLAAMSLGVMITNYSPRKSKEVFKLVGRFTPPIYVLFFVLFGAKLNLRFITLPLIFLTLFYLMGRTAGKTIGASFGARISRAPKTVQKYLPMCLFSQAGVAIGLSILAGQRFSSDIGNAIVIIITTTTFIVQIIGPPFTKWSMTKAGEVGLNITEEDLIRQSKAKDIMDKVVPVILENMSLNEVLKIFSENPYLYYPVVNNERFLLGIITVDNIKDAFLISELKGLLLAHDIMEPVIAVVTPETPMSEVKELLNKYRLEYLPVVTEEKKILGFLESRAMNKLISSKIIEMQNQADSLA